MFWEVLALIKTNPNPPNQTTLEDWMEEGDTEGMTPREIADEWDALEEMEVDN